MRDEYELIWYLTRGTGYPWAGQSATALCLKLVSFTSIVLLITLGRTDPVGSKRK